MPTPRITMRKLKDVLRRKLNADQSHQQIATALDIAKGSVTKYCGLAAAAGLDWSAVQAMSETDLERQLFGASMANTFARPLPATKHGAGDRMNRAAAAQRAA
jgi:hypothetical protein